MRIPEIYLLDGTLQSLKIPKTTNVGEPKIGSLGVNADLILCEYNGGGNWSPVVDTKDDLYPFTTHTFLGPGDWFVAPTAAQCATAYSGKPFIGDLTLFNCIDGVQIWTVPSNGTYRIQSRGGSNFNRGGGVDITTILGKGDKLRMIVGRNLPGYTSRFPYGCGAAVVYSDALGLLSIAAGCGGSTGNPVTRDAAVTVDAPGNGGGGTASSYGSSSQGAFGGGGSGFLSDGHYSDPFSPTVGRKSIRLDPTVALAGRSGLGSYTTTAVGSLGYAGAYGAFGGGGGSASFKLYGATTASCGGGAGFTGGAAQAGYSPSTLSLSAYPGTNYALAGLISRSAFLPPQYSDGQIIITKLS